MRTGVLLAVALLEPEGGPPKSVISSFTSGINYFHFVDEEVHAPVPVRLEGKIDRTCKRQEKEHRASRPLQKLPAPGG